MKSAYEYWIEKFGEEPKSTTDKLACAFAAEYGREMYSQATKDVLSKIEIFNDEIKKIKNK